MYIFIYTKIHLLSTLESQSPIPLTRGVCVCVCVCVWVCECVCSVVSNSLQPHGLEPGRLLVRGIFQARMLKCVAISYSSGSPQPRGRTWSLTSSASSGGLSVGFFPLQYLGSPLEAAAIPRFWGGLLLLQSHCRRWLQPWD